MRTFVRIASAAVLAILALAVPHARAQATGSIAGLVTDSSGGVLPGVTVEATNVNTNGVRSVVSDAEGRYTVPLVQPGTYKVKASLSGFKSAELEIGRAHV